MDPYTLESQDGLQGADFTPVIQLLHDLGKTIQIRDMEDNIHRTNSLFTSRVFGWYIGLRYVCRSTPWW